MKTIKLLLSSFFLVLMFCTHANASPFKPFQFSLWTDYKKIDFTDLSQEEKTAKLHALFIDKVDFCKKHGIRRAIIRILDPGSFDFFNPLSFDSNRDDNFYYWAIQLSQYSEVEAVFDPGSFHLNAPSWTTSLSHFAKAFFQVESSYKDFQHLVEKLTWVSLVNDMYDPSFKQGPLIKGITIDPKQIDNEQLQIVINAVDRYRHKASSEFPTNHFPNLRIAAYFNLDQRDLALVNLARFPLYTDIRTGKKGNLGVELSKVFPAQGRELLAPSWRPNNNKPLLDHAYVNMGDRRLIKHIYQNLNDLPQPHISNQAGVAALSASFSNNLKGRPIAKGPGKVTILKGERDIKGLYTFFKTGDMKNGEGMFVKNGAIEIRSPLTRPIQKTISEEPDTNKHMKITSSFSTTTDIVEADYYFNPTPIRWSTPKISNALASKIYFVFSCDFSSPNDQFMGNWNLENFLLFFQNKDHNKGFLHQPIFRNLLNKWQKPTNNIVLHDFTTIPNGTPHPEANWGLGNKVHD